MIEQKLKHSKKIFPLIFLNKVGIIPDSRRQSIGPYLYFSPEWPYPLKTVPSNEGAKSAG